MTGQEDRCCQLSRGETEMTEKTGDPPVYLDYNATTPLAPEVETAIRESLGLWGNPSSGYRTGSAAREAVTEARQRVAEMIGAEASEVTFTSGGTESNHLAIWSALASYRSSLRTEVTSDCPGGSDPACHNSSTGRPTWREKDCAGLRRC